jgi:hypothetical protein
MAKQRKRRDPEKERFWREVIRGQRNSGLTVSAFCVAEGLKDWSFHWWRRELAKRDREKPAAKPKEGPSFVPVQLLPEREAIQASSTIEVVLNSGQCVRVPTGFDPQALDSLLTVLESHRC